MEESLALRSLSVVDEDLLFKALEIKCKSQYTYVNDPKERDNKTFLEQKIINAFGKQNSIHLLAMIPRMCNYAMEVLINTEDIKDFKYLKNIFKDSYERSSVHNDMRKSCKVCEELRWLLYISEFKNNLVSKGIIKDS